MERGVVITIEFLHAHHAGTHDGHAKDLLPTVPVTQAGRSTVQGDRSGPIALDEVGAGESIDIIVAEETLRSQVDITGSIRGQFAGDGPGASLANPLQQEGISSIEQTALQVC